MTSMKYVITPPPPNPELGYAFVATAYLDRGFLPIPMIGKHPLVAGATGRQGNVSATKVHEWSMQFPHTNVGLVADGWISIDVDHHDDKYGADQLVDLVKKLGELPATISSTSRGKDSPSRQYFFKVPSNALYKSKIGADIEVIHKWHRYSVVSPSIHPDTHQIYEWYGRDSLLMAGPPRRDDFAELPSTWLEFITKREGTYESRNEYSGEILDWETLLNNEELTFFASELDQEIETITHVGHDELIKYLLQIHEYRFILFERGMQKVLNTLREKYWATTNETNPSKEWENAVRWVISSDWQAPESLPSKSMRELFESWEEKINANSQLELFWKKRPVLEATYQLARQKTVAPWSLLGAVIQRILHTVPYNVHYTTYRGPAPLNTLVAFVGRTGTGKTLGQSIINKWFVFPDADETRIGEYTWAGTTNPGSGEAMPDSYMSIEKNEDKQVVKVWVHKNHAALFAFDESGMLDARSAREGSTFIEYMKEAWSGSRFGRVLRGKTGTELPENSYRFGLFINVQPAKAQSLFSDQAIAGGLPSRFLFFSTHDPAAKEEEDLTESVITALPKTQWKGVTEIKALESMDKAHRKSALDNVTGAHIDLDSHLLMSKAKVAVALAVLDGRNSLIEEDWELSQFVIEHSLETRSMIEKELQRVSAQELNKQAQSAGTRASISEDTKDSRAIVRNGKRIRELMRSGAITSSKKRPYSETIRGNERHLYPEIREWIEKNP